MTTDGTTGTDLSSTVLLRRPGGELAYDVRGNGPVIICSPDAGDLRTTFAAYAKSLAGQGFGVATVDLRGHAASSDWQSYAEPELADDLIALADELTDHPVVLVGNGTSAAAAVHAAAARPDRIAALVLFNPELADDDRPATGLLGRLTGRSPGAVQGRKAWFKHWRKLHVHPPEDLDRRQAELTSRLSEPGRYEAATAVRETSEPGARALLARVTCPVLVMMGEDDPDVAEPALRAQNFAESLGGPARVLVVPEVGHFPQAEVPEVAASQTMAFLQSYAR